jgi:hypothetical protein
LHAKLVKLSISLLLAAGFAAYAVEFPLRWRWSNPEPHGGLVVDMAYSPTLGLGVQVAGFGQIYTSSDLDLWLPRDCPTSNALRGVTFLGSRILIVGENRTVLHADDVDDFRTGTLAGGSATNYWLEAVTASSQLAVAAGDDGHVLTSSNGMNWFHQNSGTNADLRGAAYGNNTFVVVGRNGAILSSLNGTNWTRRSSLTTYDLNRVNFANNRFTAVGANGVTRSSTDNGTNWFVESPGATNTLQYAATGGTDRLLDGIQEVRLQDNLVWSNELAKTNGPPYWSYYSAIGQAGYFLIAGQTGLQSEGYQVSGMPYFWLMPRDSVRNWLWDVMRLPSFYVTAGDFGTIMTSGNGVDWTLELVPTQVTNTTFLGVGGTTNLLLAVGDSGSMIYSPNTLTNIVITNATGVITQTVSSLGVLWYNVPNRPTTNDLQGVGVLSNSLYVITGAKGVIFTSPNGTNGWVQPASRTTNLLSSVTDWPGGLIAVGKNGTLLRSPDGSQWTKVSLGLTNWLYRVRWLNQQLVAVGQGGKILTSANGLTWTSRTSGTTSSLYDAAFVQDTWFAFGLGGAVLSSSNLVNWTSRSTITTKTFLGAATDPKQLVLVGLEGVILRSQVVPDPTPVSFLNYARLSTNTPPTTYNLYLFGGKPDQRFTLDRCTNILGSAWTTGPLLEIFDGSGTLYYLETLTGTNTPPVEYYRTTLDF